MDLAIVLRYRKAVTYGHHCLLGALEEHRTDTRFEVTFAGSEDETVAAIASAGPRAGRVLVLWSFYSPDAEELAAELARIRARTDATNVLHLAGGVHATAEPVQTLAAGWDVAAVGEGEPIICALVDNAGDPTGVPGLVYRGADGQLVKGPRPARQPLDAYRAFSPRWQRYSPIEVTRGCIYACRFCQTPFMFSAKFRHRSVENVRWHVRQLRAFGLRDVRFITPTSLSYGSADEQPNLDAVQELLAACVAEIGPGGRVFFGSFPSEIRPEHMTPAALRLIRRYCANDNLIVGAQSGSDDVLDLAKRGHGVAEVRRAVRVGIAEGFRINVDMIFGMPGEDDAAVRQSLALAEELAGLGARIHAHTFMPLPGTPWRDAPPGDVSDEVIRRIGDLSRRGAIYGHWQKQRAHAVRLAAAAEEFPRPGVSRTLPLVADRLRRDPA
jgi:B12-binding domain/radical SAM domain protein